jgi:signal transduction histidine kinase
MPDTTQPSLPACRTDRRQLTEFVTLHEFITAHRDELIRRCGLKVASRSTPPPTETEIDRGVPVFLDQLVDALRRGLTSADMRPQISDSAMLHGHDLLRRGLTVSQVVHNYGDICQAITELAGEQAAPIRTADFQLLNGCLDDAIAGAVTQYGRERDQSTIEGEAVRENERLGFFAHELRNLLQTAMIAFEVVKSGNVGVAGSTGSVLHRSLVGARDLIARSLAEVRLTQGVQNSEQFLVAAFVDELSAAAAMESNTKAIRFKALPVEDGVMIEGDRQVLMAVVRNLLQNAFKFTRPRSTVVLRVGASAERVLIEIQDECGGLANENDGDLFRPFEQRSADRTGMGLGLAFCRWATEASRGRIHARSLPGVGCVFTVDLPRVHLAAPPT